MAPITVDGLDIEDATIDGDVVDEITMDGDVVYQASAIPDSGGDHQWNIDEGSGATIEDSNGGLDGTIDGATWQSGLGGTDDTILFYDGSDETHISDSTEMTHWLNDGEGTVFSWIKPTNYSSDRYFVLGSGATDSDKAFGLFFRGDDFRFRIGDGDDTSTVRMMAGTPSDYNDEWIGFGATADGSTARMYIATPGDYTVTEIESESVSDTSSGSWTYDVLMGNNPRSSGENFEGHIDLTIHDSSGMSESGLQSWVDDTKGFYE